MEAAKLQNTAIPICCSLMSLSTRTFIQTEFPPKLRLLVTLKPELAQDWQLTGGYPLLKPLSWRWLWTKWETVDNPNATVFEYTTLHDQQHVNVNVPDGGGDYRLVVVLAPTNKEENVERAKEMIESDQALTVTDDPDVGHGP